MTGLFQLQNFIISGNDFFFVCTEIKKPIKNQGEVFRNHQMFSLQMKTTAVFSFSQISQLRLINLRSNKKAVKKVHLLSTQNNRMKKNKIQASTFRSTLVLITKLIRPKNDITWNIMIFLTLSVSFFILPVYIVQINLNKYGNALQHQTNSQHLAQVI